MSLRAELEGVERLSKDLREAAATLSPHEVRFVVDLYYQLQRNRIASMDQVRKMTESEEPHELVSWVGENSRVLETQIKNALDRYSDAHVPGRWAKSIIGIGPVISAGLLAHIDITRAPTVGHIWRFAGLDPTVKWSKGQKRPWNARLKVLCWKLGESFKKRYNHPDDIYGKVYIERKQNHEIPMNEAGVFRELAERKLAEVPRWKDQATKKIYESGRLPAGRLDLRAMRYATKLFLAHFHHVWYMSEYGVEPPKPYILTQPGHTHYIAPPHWPIA